MRYIVAVIRSKAWKDESVGDIDPDWGILGKELQR
jgi:hypothetical protein